MMLFPFTSIVNSLNNHYDRDDAKAANDSNVTLFTNAINTYNDSIFSKVFFNWTKGDGTDSFDTQLVSFLTQGQYGDMKANFVSSVGEVTDIANIAVKSGILSAASSGKIQAGMIIGSDVIPELLYTFSDSTLVKNLLPVGIAIATSLDQVKSVLGTDTCAYLASASVDWSKEFSNLGDIYRHVAATGVLDSLVDSEGNFKFEAKDLLGLFSTSSNAYGALHAVFSSIDDLSVFNHLVAGALATFVSSDDQKDDGDPATLQLVDFLPKDSSGKVTSDSLMKVEWGNELMRVYDSLYRLNLVDATILSTIFSSFTASSSNSSTAPLHTLRPATSASSTSSSADPGTAIFNTLIHAFAEHSAQVKTILVGATDSFGNLTDANSDGTSSSGCLFDSTLVQTALPSLLNFAAASLNSNTSSHRREDDRSLWRHHHAQWRWETRDEAPQLQGRICSPLRRYLRICWHERRSSFRRRSEYPSRHLLRPRRQLQFNRPRFAQGHESHLDRHGFVQSPFEYLAGPLRWLYVGGQ
jgi:hypothetical protein